MAGLTRVGVHCVGVHCVRRPEEKEWVGRIVPFNDSYRLLREQGVFISTPLYVALGPRTAACRSPANRLVSNARIIPPKSRSFRHPKGCEPQVNNWDGGISPTARLLPHRHGPLIVEMVKICQSLLKAAPTWRLFSCRPTRVPLSKHCGGVASCSKLCSDAGHRAGHSRKSRFRIGSVDDRWLCVQHVDMVRVAATLQCRSGRRTILVGTATSGISQNEIGSHG